MHEKLDAFQRLDNFIAPFQEEYNAWCEANRQDSPMEHRCRYTVGLLARLRGLHTGCLSGHPNCLILFTDMVRVLDYILYAHPNAIDQAFEELVSIALELYPDADRTYLTRPDNG